MMIVDDEPATVEGLLQCVDWSALGIYEIRTAHNGRDALVMAEDFLPHLILTDIAMPKMDGVELAKALAAQQPDCKIIFITGYWELEYCKSAFKNGVVDYILKPVNINELSLTIEDVAHKIVEEQSHRAYLQTMEERLHQSLPAMRTKFFVSLLAGEITSKEYILERLALLNVVMPFSGLYDTLAIKVEDDSQFCRTGNPVDRGLLEVALTNMVSELICLQWEGLCLESQDGVYACLVYLDQQKLSQREISPEEAIVQLADSLHQNLAEHLRITTTIGVGQWVGSLSQLYGCFRSAVASMNQRFYTGGNRVILADKATQQPDQHISFREMSNIADLLRSGDIEGVMACIERIDRQVRGATRNGRAYGLGLYIQLYSMIIGSTAEFTNPEEKGMQDFQQDFSEIFASQTLDEVKSIVEDRVKTIHQKLMESRSRESAAVKQIKEYIHENYQEKLSIHKIASDVYLSVSYICLLFKQETGITINQYLTDIRLQEAARLIRETDMRLIDIGNEVGYSDPKYFAKIFKKAYGVKPSEFK